MPNRTVLKNGIVLSLDKRVGNFMQADVLIDGAKIGAVGPSLKAEGAEIIDASNMIVMPGFIDTHRHLWEGILRNIGTDIPLEGAQSYLAFVLNTLAPAYRAEDVYVGNKVSTLGLIDAGITTILDWSHIQAGPEHTDAAIKALQESGLRVVFAYGPVWYEAPKPEHPEWFRRTARQYFSSKDQLLTLAWAGYGPEFNSVEGNQADWKLAREVDVIMLRTDKPNIFPINDPIGAVVWGMDTSNVDSVFVAGQPLKRNGQLLKVDLNSVKKMAYASRDYVVSKSGFKLPTI